MFRASEARATTARRPLLAPALTTWALILFAVALLSVSFLAVVSLAKLDTKLAPFTTIQVYGIGDAHIAREMANRFTESEPLRPQQIEQLTWFLRQCGTTVLKGEHARASDEPKSPDDLPVISCGIDPERGTQWYELGSGVLEIGANGPVYVPEYGEWHIEYAERAVPTRTARLLKTQHIARVVYSGLPEGFRLWTELPSTTAVSWEKGVAPWRVSWPVLVSLSAVVLAGMPIGFMGLSAWRQGSSHRLGALAVTLWATALLVIYIWAMLDVQAAENFVDVLQNSRPGVTRLPWILTTVIVAWGFAIAYWLHLPVGMGSDEPLTQA
jgi:hypothetical protein